MLDMQEYRERWERYTGVLVSTWYELEEVLEHLRAKASRRAGHNVLGHLDEIRTTQAGGDGGSLVREVLV